MSRLPKMLFFIILWLLAGCFLRTVDLTDGAEKKNCFIHGDVYMQVKELKISDIEEYDRDLRDARTLYFPHSDLPVEKVSARKVVAWVCDECVSAKNDWFEKKGRDLITGH
jgi:hypothetical protein